MALKIPAEEKTPTQVHTLSDITEANGRKHLKKQQLFTIILDRVSGQSNMFSAET